MEEYHEFNIHKNIFLVTTGILMVGPWNDEKADMTIDNNIYWHATKGKEGIKFRYLNYTQWKARGYDLNSLIEDPMFTDHEKRDFTFKDEININKIGFEPFSLEFGVTGEDYWLELANGKKIINSMKIKFYLQLYFILQVQQILSKKMITF